MRKPLTQEQKRARDKAQARYDAEHTTRVYLKLNNTTDADILDKLASVQSKQAYIKKCIRDNISTS